MTVYDIVLEQITTKLEQGIIPWKQTWKSGQLPMNYVSKKGYRGINLVLLAGSPYTSPYYLSFKQIKERGAQIKPGESGHPIVFFKACSVLDDNDSGYLVMRYYRVWNVQQTTLPIPAELEADQAPDPIPGCEAMLNGMRDKPSIENGHNHPCYIPGEDRVMLPPISSFYAAEEYYAALFHELIHSTGHEKRLARFRADSMSLFGSESYSEEELVAEIGASFLCGQTGILPQTIDNNTAYIQSWLKAIRGNKKLFIHASSAAQKAVDYLIGVESSTPFFSYWQQDYLPLDQEVLQVLNMVFSLKTCLTINLI